MAFEVNYSRLDRLFHRVAFVAPSVQLTAADIEKTAFGAVYDAVEVVKPVFVTSLPRAGTTLTLEALCRFPSLAAHTYRDMPFILAPVLWSRLSGAFRKRAELRERAHGDGMQVGYDSPEAFEEVLWRTLWPEKYDRTRIALWGPDDADQDARAFFTEHLKKIIALRRPDNPREGRYISKNNANLSRLDLLGRMFPEAKLLVPVRRPRDHAASLLRQHRNFIEMHRREPFVRRYMADIGHYEFGGLHRPIAFPGLEELIAGRDPSTIDYWLAYWIAAFDHVLSRHDLITVVSYEALCANPRRELAELSARLEIPEEGLLDVAAALFRPPRSVQEDHATVDPRLRERAEELYTALTSG